MAKVTPILWSHKDNADGHFPIWLRVADRHRTLYYSTGEYIAKRFWNPNAHRVRTSHPAAEELNALIEERLALAQSERARLKRKGESITAEILKAVLVAADPDRAAGDYLRYADAHVEALKARGQIREHKRQKAVIAKLRDYTRGALPFERVTPRFLKDYETHLLGLGNKPSTANSNLRVFRTIFYAAIKEGLVPQEKNPFFQFSPVRPNRPDRPKLTAEQVRAVEAVDLGGRGPSGPLVARVRDAFLFSFYSAGVRFTDVALMRRSNVVEAAGEDGEPQIIVSYTMGKTQKPFTVRLNPAGVGLVRSYLTREAEGGDPFLFPMMDGYDVSTPEKLVQASGSQNVVVNKALKKIAAAVEAAGTPMPQKLTFHIARHTWADLARKSGRDVYEVSKGMGHSALNVTEHYLARFDGDVVDGEV